RRHLLDGAVALRAEARALFSALPGVAAATKGVHRDGERLMGLAADRSEGHRAGYESFDDHRRRLHVIEWHSVARREVEQAAQGPLPNGFLVREVAELAERRAAVAARRVLQPGDRRWIPRVMLTLSSVVVF